MSDLVLFPVGQYLGPVHPGAGLPVRHHQVRVGWDVLPVDDGLDLDVWALAHGHPAVVGRLPTTRAVLAAVAAEGGLAVPTAVVDRLVGRGLLVEVDVHGADGERFARTHRLLSLLTGLGDAGPDRTGIGLLGAPPLREVSAAVFEYWAWAPLFPDLRSAADGLAEMAAGTPGTTAVSTDPGEVLVDLLGSLHELLCVDGAYLDVVRTAR